MNSSNIPGSGSIFDPLRAMGSQEHRLVFQKPPEAPPPQTEAAEVALSKKDVLKGFEEALHTPSLTPTIESIWERGPEEQKELRQFLAHMTHGADRFLAILRSLSSGKLSEDEQKELQRIQDPARALGAITKKQLDIRGELVDALRGELKEERKNLPQPTPLVEIETRSSPPTEVGNNIRNLERMQASEALQELEELLSRKRPDFDDRSTWRSNPLYKIDKRGRMVVPYFPTITYAQRILAVLPQAIDQEKPDDEKQATRARIENLQRSFETFAIENPIAYSQHLGNEMQPSPLYAKPLRLAALGVATVAGLMALIPILRKLKKGEDLALSDWPAAVWPVLGGYLSGFLPFKSTGPLAQIAEAGVTVASDTSKEFRDIVKEVGVEPATAAVRNLDDLLKESTTEGGRTVSKRTILEKALESPQVTLQFLQDFTGEQLQQGVPPKSPLLAAFAGVSNEKRHAFLSKLYYELKVTGRDASRRDVAIAAMEPLKNIFSA